MFDSYSQISISLMLACIQLEYSDYLLTLNNNKKQHLPPKWYRPCTQSTSSISFIHIWLPLTTPADFPYATFRLSSITYPSILNAPSMVYFCGYSVVLSTIDTDGDLFLWLFTKRTSFSMVMFPIQPSYQVLPICFYCLLPRYHQITLLLSQ
ncbi:hypothetical protein BDB01DRAFT_838898 [Pilobolus umbonatus]|nr:hypothetical protein BDB01DRAFT_838898 [Pilobolus umbonatus]